MVISRVYLSIVLVVLIALSLAAGFNVGKNFQSAQNQAQTRTIKYTSNSTITQAVTAYSPYTTTRTLTVMSSLGKLVITEFYIIKEVGQIWEFVNGTSTSVETYGVYENDCVYYSVPYNGTDYASITQTTITLTTATNLTETWYFLPNTTISPNVALPRC